MEEKKTKNEWKRPTNKELLSCLTSQTQISTKQKGMDVTKISQKIAWTEPGVKKSRAR